MIIEIVHEGILGVGQTKEGTLGRDDKHFINVENGEELVCIGFRVAMNSGWGVTLTTSGAGRQWSGSDSWESLCYILERTQHPCHGEVETLL